MIGLLNVYKPRNIASTQVVTRVKHLVNGEKVGHLGTLDPLAEGVLVIAIGKATKLFDLFLTKKKSYIATFRFGEQTDTLDLEGKVVKTSLNIPSENQLSQVIKEFIGKIMQTPPIFSAINVGGKRAYDLARVGKEISLKPVEREIFEFELQNKIDEKTYQFLITCSSGTYIRAVARDLAERCNTACTMIELKRIKCGDFDYKDSVEYNSLSLENIKQSLVLVQNSVNSVPKVEISESEYKKLRDGKLLKIKGTKQEEHYFVMCNSTCVGLAKLRKDNTFKVEIYFV